MTLLQIRKRVEAAFCPDSHLRKVAFDVCRPTGVDHETISVTICSFAEIASTYEVRQKRFERQGVTVPGLSESLSQFSGRQEEGEMICIAAKGGPRIIWFYEGELIGAIDFSESA